VRFDRPIAWPPPEPPTPAPAGTAAAGISEWTGHPAIAIFACSITAFYLLMVAIVVITALVTSKRDERHKTALQVLKTLAGGKDEFRPGGKAAP
jgi:hypothetical protein